MNGTRITTAEILSTPSELLMKRISDAGLGQVHTGSEIRKAIYEAGLPVLRDLRAQLNRAIAPLDDGFYDHREEDAQR